jgi:hypothetical protein
MRDLYFWHANLILQNNPLKQQITIPWYVVIMHILAEIREKK